MALTEETAVDKIEIPGYEGLYSITFNGQVWSHKTNKWLKPAIIRSGYKAVRLNGKTISVHRLVASTFCDNPNRKPQVNHIDGNKLNNQADNLEWVTAAENGKHAYDTGLQSSSVLQRLTASKQAKAMGYANRALTMDQARSIRSRHADGERLKQLAEEYNVSIFVASNIVTNRSYKETM